MNTAQLVEKVAKVNTVPKSQAKALVESVLTTIQTAVKRGDKVTLSGFGTFTRNRRNARDGRNPRTGQPIRIKATRYPKFKAGRGFREEVGSQ